MVFIEDTHFWGIRRRTVICLYRNTSPHYFAARLWEKVLLSGTVFLGTEDRCEIRPSLAKDKKKGKNRRPTQMIGESDENLGSISKYKGKGIRWEVLVIFAFFYLQSWPSFLEDSIGKK